MSKNMNIKNINKNDLVDITKINIDENLTKEEKIKEFFKQIKNPYYFKIGDICINVEYNKNGPTFEECIKQYIDSL